MVIQMETKDLSRPVPVVRIIVSGNSGRVLVLRRAADTTSGGTWCLPGGKIDYGDTVEQAAARELEEETGLRAADLRFLFYQDSLPTAPGGVHCLNLYLECAAEGELSLNSESADFAWIARHDLEQYRLAFRNGEALARYWTEQPPRGADAS